jgi:ABC-type multidrug transport system fused ATPase/permease subunit
MEDNLLFYIKAFLPLIVFLLFLLWLSSLFLTTPSGQLTSQTVQEDNGLRNAVVFDYILRARSSLRP